MEEKIDFTIEKKYACFKNDPLLKSLAVLGERAFPSMEMCFDLEKSYGLPSPFLPCFRMLWKRENRQRFTWIVLMERLCETINDTKIKLLEGEMAEATNQLVCIKDVVEAIHKKLVNTPSDDPFSDAKIEKSESSFLDPEPTIAESVYDYDNTTPEWHVLICRNHTSLRGHADVLAAVWPRGQHIVM